jgi:hypothetical protein
MTSASVSAVSRKPPIRRQPDIGDWVRLRRPYHASGYEAGQAGPKRRFTKGIVSEILKANYHWLYVIHFPGLRNRDGSCVNVDFGSSSIKRME